MDIKEFPRAQPANPYNYDEDQLAAKILALEKMKVIYPTVDPYYAGLVYDMCVNTAPDKIEEIKKRVETTPFKYDYSTLQEELNKVKEAYELVELTEENLKIFDKELGKE